MSAKPDKLRVAAVGDIHVHENSSDVIQEVVSAGFGQCRRARALRRPDPSWSAGRGRAAREETCAIAGYRSSQFWETTTIKAGTQKR